MNQKTAAWITLLFVVLLIATTGTGWPNSVIGVQAAGRVAGLEPTTNAGDATLRVTSSLTTTTRYTITDLGTLGGTSYAHGLNEKGQVVGNSGAHAFLWLPEPAYGLPAGMNDLGTLGGGMSRAEDINDEGQVVGWAETADSERRAFLWLPEPAYSLPAGMNDLGHLGSGTSRAYAVNDAGQVVGSSQLPYDTHNGETRAFLWENGAMTDLGTLGGTFSLAYGVNGSGQVVGESRVENDDDYHPFLWENGSMTDLGTLGGGPDSAALDINEAGESVGTSENPTARPALWLPEPAYGFPAGINELETLGGTRGRAKAINNAGQVVGSSDDSSNQWQPVLWENGTVTDLNDLIDPDAGWVLQSAEDINDAGQIVGSGIIDGQTRAYLLTPEQTPWTVMFYLDGDNDLAGTQPPILNQLELAADNPNANVVVLWDGAEIGDSAYIAVQHDTDLSNSFDYTEGENYWDQGELDMSYPTTLTDFVTWAMSNYPARHYALFLTDHGSGLGGGLVDDADGGFHMQLDDMQQALVDTPTLVGDSLDVLYLDMCLMGMLEVGYEMRDYTDFMVASEYLQWGVSSPYFDYIDGIDADTTPEALAAHFAGTYAATVAPDDLPYTISAVSMSELDNVVAATDALAQALQDNMEAIAFTLGDVADQVQRYDMNGDGAIDTDDSYADLYHLAQLIEQELADYPDIVAEAQAVQTAVLSYVVAEAHESSQAVDLANSHGVSIFFPANASSYYDGFNNDFAAGTDWGGIVAGAVAPQDVNAEGIAWGPMLVDYIQQVNPDGPDTSEPPAPVGRLVPQAGAVYVPIVLSP